MSGDDSGSGNLFKAAAKQVANKIKSAIKKLAKGVAKYVLPAFVIICLVIFLLIAAVVSSTSAQAFDNGLCLAGSAYKPTTDGKPNPTVINAIFKVLTEKHADARVQLAAFEVAIAESGAKNIANDNIPESLTVAHDLWHTPPGAANGSNFNSVGVFQQQVNMGWAQGTLMEQLKQLMDPGYAAQQFIERAINAEKTISASASTGELAQAVQISGDRTGNNYNSQQSAAQGMLSSAQNGTAGAGQGTASSGAICSANTTLLVTNGVTTLKNICAANVFCVSTAPKQTYVYSVPAGEAGKAVLAALTEASIPFPYAWNGGSWKGPGFGTVFDATIDDSKVFGFDCSGLTAYAVAQGTNNRIKLDDFSVAQETETTPVSAPAPGDLIFYGPRGGTHHVAMFMGNMTLVGSTWTSTTDNSGTPMLVEAPQSGELLHIRAMTSGETPSAFGHPAYQGSVVK